MNVQHTIIYIIISIYCFLFIAEPISSQNWKPNIKNLRKIDGIKDVSYNNFVFKDSKGFIWISTGESLDRYNGNEIISFPLNSDEPGTIQGNYIQGNFFEDKRDHIWFATYNAINRYNPVNETFKAIKLTNSKGDIIQEGYHLIFLNKPRDIAFVLANKRIYQIDLNNLSDFTALPIQTEGIRFSVSLNAKGEVDKIYAGFWVKNGFNIYKKETSKLWSSQYYALEKLGKPKITKVITGIDNKIWLIGDKGLILFDSKLDTLIGFYPPANKNIVFKEAAMNDEHNILVTTFDTGILFFDTKTKKFDTQFKISKELDARFSSNNPYEIYIDNDQRTWVSQRNIGVDIITEPRFKIDFTSKDQFNFNNSSFKQIRLLDDDYFILTDLSAFIKVKQKKGKNSTQWYTENYDFPKIESFTIDADGDIWVLSETAIWKYKDDAIQEIVKFNNMQIFNLLHVSKSKKLVSTTQGLVEISINKDEIKSTFLKEKLPIQLQAVTNLFKRKNGQIIMAINANSLVLCELKDSLKVLKQEFIKADILSVHESTKTNNYWLGTSKGLAQLNENNDFNYFLQNDWEIGKRKIINIFEGNANHLWLTTSDEIWRYHLLNKTLIKCIDRLAGYKFLPNSIFIKKSKELCLATTDGLLCFLVDSFQIPQNKHNVSIDKAWINNNPYNSEIVINEKRNLELKHIENTFDFELVTLDYEFPEQNKVRYKLKGYDEDWHLIKSGEVASYTKVPAGKTYQLEVIGINAYNQESPLKTLTIKINLPFWKTWWFPFALILIITSIIALIAHLYLRQQLKQKQRELDRQLGLSQQRKEIADNLHDEIGTDLSKILATSELALLEENDRMKAEVDNIAEMTVASLRNLRYMMKILDAQEKEQEPLTNLLKEIREVAHQFLDKQCAYEFQFAEMTNTIFFNGKAFREILLIVKESLNNTLKHAKANKVWIRLMLENDAIIIQIQDDGKGFDKAITSNGRGLHSIQRRVNKLNGNLKLDTQIGIGTTLHFTIPIEKQPPAK